MPTCCCTSSMPPIRERDDRIAEVDDVLDEIGAGDMPQLLVYNKIDLWPSAC